jgi:diguanylate cyclase (GGDEF)-like protein
MIGTPTRTSGLRNYRFATAALREGRFMRVFARIASLGCFALAGLCVLTQLHAQGPHGAAPRAAQAAVLVTAIIVGSRWLWWPWPSYPQSVAFAVWLDVSIAVLAVTMSTSTAALCVVLFMGVNGVFVAFVLGWRMQVVHLAFCAVVTALIVTDALVTDHERLDSVLLLLAPVLTWVFAVSTGGSVMVEYGRKAVRRTARSAHYDPLTGLRNRRGMYAGIRDALARSDESVTVIAAVCDIDRFKKVNDDNGHAVGDAALAAMARHLRSLALPAELTARIGGDELVLVAFAGIDDADSVIAELLSRLQPLTRAGTFELPLTASIGLAAHSTADPHFSVDDVLRHADSAMYDAKRAGGAACARYATESTMDAAAGRSRPDRPA